MPIDRCGFSSWRDRKKKSNRPDPAVPADGEQRSRPRAVPAAGSARSAAGVRPCASVCPCVPACVRVCPRVCPGVRARAALTGALGRGSAAPLPCRVPARRRGGCAAPAPPLTPPRPSPPLLRSSGLSTRISLPNIPTAAIQQKLSLYQDSSNTSQGKPDVK